MKFINIGFGNYVNIDKITSITATKSAPLIRRVRDAADKNLIDCTMGRKTNSIIFTESGQIILSSNDAKTLIKRVEE